MADPGVKQAYEEETPKAEKPQEETASEEKKDEVSDILKTLERVTMELPKLVLNENGEYVAAE